MSRCIDLSNTENAHRVDSLQDATSGLQHQPDVGSAGPQNPDFSTKQPLSSDSDAAVGSVAASGDYSGGDMPEIERFHTAGEVLADLPPDVDNMDITQNDEKKIRQLLRYDENTQTVKQFLGWLGKDVMLQGTFHITQRYLLFYAHLPPATLDVLQASPLDKKSASLIPGKASYTRFWFVLRMGSLSWYANAGDKYFPVGLLPLHLMETISQLTEAPEKFVIKAYNGKSYTFRADSRNGAHLWVKSIRKEMFRSKVKTKDFSAVVRIPMKNIIHAETKRILDIANLLSVQVVASAQDPTNAGYPLVGNYSFVFFGDKTPSDEICGMLEEYTNNFEHQRGASIKFEGNSQLTVDYAASNFGPIDEDMLDTTPPSVFHLYEGTEFGSDKDVMVSPGLINDSTLEEKSEEDPTVSNSISVTRSNSRSGSISPTGGSHSLSKSKLNVFSTLSHRLQRLTHEGSIAPSALSLSDLNSIIGVTSVPFKFLKPSDDEADSDDENADVDYESNDVDRSVGPKFSDDRLFPFIPQNFARKLTFSSASSQPSEVSKVHTTWVENEAEILAMNEWFRDFFGLEPFVSLIAEYICTIHKPGESSAWEGKLMISNFFLCFQRCNGTSGGESRMVIPLGDIIHFKTNDPRSPSIRFEVSASAYGVFELKFSDPNTREDAEIMLRDAVGNVPLDSQGAILVKGKAPSFNHLDYDLESSRLATYEPSLTNKLRARIPPLCLDPYNPDIKEEYLNVKPKQSLKFLMLMIGSRGDVQPYIALCQGLMKEGHRCCITTHKEFKDFVEKYGIEFREIAGDPRELMEIMISHGSISYSFIKDALHHFKRWLKDLMRTAWTQIKDSGADVMIESPSSMIGHHIAEALNIAYFRAFTMPWTRTKSYPQALVMPDQKKSGTYNSLTYVMYERAVWFAISRYVNKWRKKHLGLPSTDLDSQRLEELPFLYCVSPTVLVPPIDQADWIHTCGYWELQSSKKDEDEDEDEDIDPKLKAFLEESKSEGIPVAYIGFGSIIVEDPQAMTESVVEATRKAGVNCVLARGWSSRSTKEDKKKKDKDKKDKTPIKADHVFEVDSVDHQWLFPRIQVCVHHGGSGTTGASLRAGRPTIIKPFFGDQFFYGNRVEDLGVGVYLKQLTTSGLTSALKECVSNKEMIRQAEVLGGQIRRENGVKEGIISIYRELAYAKDVTERRRRRTLEASKRHLLISPSSLWNHDSWMPKSIQTHRWSRSNDEEIEKEESHSFFSFPKLGHREEQRRNKSAPSGEIDVSL